VFTLKQAQAYVLVSLGLKRIPEGQ